MQAPCYTARYSVSYTMYNQDPYNKADHENGWPDNIGVPIYFTADLGLSLRSRFSLPAAPWTGTDNAMLNIFIRYGKIAAVGTENFDPPAGYVFVGPPFSGDPWRRWESSYEYVCLGGPYAWDTYIYRASGVFVHPLYRHILTPTALKAGGVNMIPALAGLGVLSMLAASSNAASIIGRRRRKS
jgi:hypothetical protein